MLVQYTKTLREWSGYGLSIYSNIYIQWELSNDIYSMGIK